MRPPSGRSGFTLVEVTLALVLLAFVVIGLQQTTGRFLHVVVEDRVRAEADAVADSRVAQVRLWPDYTSIEAQFAGTVRDQPRAGWSVATTVIRTGGQGRPDALQARHRAGDRADDARVGPTHDHRRGSVGGTMQRTRGMTLIEMLVSITVFFIVLSVTLKSLSSQSRGLTRGAETMGMLQNQRFSTSLVTQDVQTAGAHLGSDQPPIVYAGANAFAFNADYAANTPGDPFATYVLPEAPAGQVTACAGRSRPPCRAPLRASSIRRSTTGTRRASSARRKRSRSSSRPTPRPPGWTTGSCAGR